MARVVSYAKDFLRRFDRVTEKILTECAIVTVNEAQRLMTESPRSGKFYARGRRRMKRGATSASTAQRFPRASSIHARFAAVAPRVFHRASAPGEPPAVDRGTLRASVTYDVRATPRGFEARIGTPLRTGRWLEFGTSRIKPRPWLRPAVLNSQAKYQEIARKHRDGGGPPSVAAAVAR